MAHAHTHELWILVYHHAEGVWAYPVDIEAGVPLPDPAQVIEYFGVDLEPGEDTQWCGPFHRYKPNVREWDSLRPPDWRDDIWRRDPPRCLQCNEPCTLLYPSHHLTAEGDNLDDDHEALPDRGEGYASDTR